MYSARITRNNPTAFIFLIDRSGSMEEKMDFGNISMTKAEVVAMVTNMLIRELINRCKRESGIVDYFDIAAIGYASDGAKLILGEKDTFTRPSTLAMTECRKKTFIRERELPDGTTVITNDELRYWIEPKAEGITPMKSALEYAYSLTSRWCRMPVNKKSYPPTIFNITDGEASDGDHDALTELAEQIKSLRTEDGNALLININLASGTHPQAVIFPSGKDELPVSRYTDMLYDMSSVMPEEYNDAITNIKGPGSTPPYRGISYNTSVTDLVAMMDIGSRSINKMQ